MESHLAFGQQQLHSFKASSLNLEDSESSRRRVPPNCPEAVTTWLVGIKLKRTEQSSPASLFNLKLDGREAGIQMPLKMRACPVSPVATLDSVRASEV